MKKDIPRGTYRVADGASVLGEGNSDSDFAHITRATPLQTKVRELENDPRYRTEAAPDTNKTREQRTTRLRRDKEVKPI